MSPTHILIFVTVFGTFSLIATYFLFQKMSSWAKASGKVLNQNVQYGGALAGFVIVFAILNFGFVSLSDHFSDTEIDISGKWALSTSGDNNTSIALGTATIVQTNGSSNFEITGTFQNASIGLERVTFQSEVGRIRDRTMFFIYVNSDRERGICEGIIETDRPNTFFITYTDLIGADFNNDPKGRIDLTRME